MDKNVVVPERYSFSKLSAWWTCPYGYYQRYIERKKGIGNAFSSFGTLVHDIMERYAKGTLQLWDLACVYEWEFDSAVKENFPPNNFVDLKDTYYKQGLNFLKNFEGYDDIKILGAEEDFVIKIDDWEFNGIIDLLYEDANGKLIIRDYKSKASFKNAEEQKKYARQLYLYSMHVKEKYGRFPDELQFLMFRKQKEPVVIPFCQDDYDEALTWAKKTVEIIRNAIDYPSQCDEFYGNYLCNHREYCDLKVEAPKKKKGRPYKKR